MIYYKTAIKKQIEMLTKYFSPNQYKHKYFDNSHQINKI